MEGNYRLGQWVSVQRYSKDFLSVERKRLLDAIGFIWDWRDQLWEQNFATLIKFKRRRGHCCIPTDYHNGNLKLGWWVATQRRNRKIMSPERRARLNNLGFVWKVRPSRERAVAAGVKFGRKRKLSDYQRAEAIKRRYAGETLADIAKSYGVHLAMISRL
jgi:hypothetical protein